MEDYAYILDYLAQGLPTGNFKREPLCYALGESEFKIFELVPLDKAVINIGERVYIGKDSDKRDKISHVKRRVGFNELTHAAQAEMEFIVQDIVSQNETRFVNFFNKAESISTKKHMLEELPGLGKKTMWAVVEERKKGDFKDFDDLVKRVPSVKHPEKLVAKRIENELSDPGQKYRLFVSR